MLVDVMAHNVKLRKWEIQKIDTVIDKLHHCQHQVLYSYLPLQHNNETNTDHQDTATVSISNDRRGIKIKLIANPKTTKSISHYDNNIICSDSGEDSDGGGAVKDYFFNQRNFIVILASSEEDNSFSLNTYKSQHQYQCNTLEKRVIASSTSLFVIWVLFLKFLSASARFASWPTTENTNPNVKGPTSIVSVSKPTTNRSSKAPPRTLIAVS